MMQDLYDPNKHQEDIFAYAREPASSTEFGAVKVSDSYDKNKKAADGWSASPLALQRISERIYMVRAYAAYNNESGGRLLARAIPLPSGISAGINQFAVSIETESENDCACDHFVAVGVNSASVYFRNRDGSPFDAGRAIWFNAIIVVNR